MFGHIFMKIRKSVVPLRAVQPGLQQGTRRPKSWRGNFNFKFFQKLISYSGHRGVQLGTVDGILVKFGHIFLKIRKSVVPVRAVQPGLQQGTRCPKSWRGNFDFKFFQKINVILRASRRSTGLSEWNIGHVWTYFFENSGKCCPSQSCPTRASTGYKVPQVLEGKF